jgi:hypothetical protein
MENKKGESPAVAAKNAAMAGKEAWGLRDRNVEAAELFVRAI